MRIHISSVLFLFLFIGLCHAEEPVLVIRANGEKRAFTRAQLLKHPALERLTLNNVPAFAGKKVTMKVIPTAALFEGISVNPNGAILFFCQDGFSAPFPQGRLLNTSPDQAISYLAIEEKGEWPKIKKGSESAGPLYLVWTNTEKSYVTGMEWPYQLVAFEVVSSLKELYPEIFPDTGLGEKSGELRGYAVFEKNCFACHRMNFKGTSEIGPDLNVPMNPTEYMQPGVIKKLVRNPQDVRHWPQGRMSGFDPKILSDEELDDLLKYLKHMAGRKIQSKN